MTPEERILLIALILDDPAWTEVVVAAAVQAREDLFQAGPRPALRTLDLALAGKDVRQV